MLREFSLIHLAVYGCLAACGADHASEGAAPRESGENERGAGVSAEDDSSCAIALERAGIPNGYHYRVVLACDGSVDWWGTDGVAHVGARSGRADTARIRFLWDHVSSLRAFSDAAEYDAVIEESGVSCFDLPPGSLTVALEGGGAKRETRLQSCNPGNEDIKALLRWTREIDEVAGTAAWVFGAPDVRDFGGPERPDIAVQTYPDD